MFEVIDVLKNDFWKHRLLEEIPKIFHSGHPKATNYLNFQNRLPLYDCFNILVKDNAILAMSGLFNGGNYPKNMARAFDRTYYFGWNINGGTTSTLNFNNRFNTSYILEQQIQTAREKNYDLVFISIENPKHRRALAKLALNQPKYKMELLPGLYNTCRRINNTTNEDQICWQNVCVHKLNPAAEFNLPSISIESFYERYQNS